jgi:hypothetical protein
VLSFCCRTPKRSDELTVLTTRESTKSEDISVMKIFVKNDMLTVSRKRP